jgi:hypothetical protein
MQRGAYFSVPALARRVFARKHADLDQFMTLEIIVDFVEHSRTQTGIPDYDHGTQVVCARTQRAALCRCQFENHDRILTDEKNQD